METSLKLRRKCLTDLKELLVSVEFNSNRCFALGIATKSHHTVIKKRLSKSSLELVKTDSAGRLADHRLKRFIYWLVFSTVGLK